MRFSVGVPAFNQGSFLRQTVESLLHQADPFDELVVSNNHSTDSTADVLAQLQNEFPGRIRVVTPPTHLSMAANWNYTVSQLTGDWFSLLSSDDLAMPNFVSSVKAACRRSSNTVLVRGAWLIIDEQGQTLNEHHLLSVKPITSPPRTLFEQRFGPKGSFAAFALRRDIWEKVGGFPERVTLLADWGMWLLAGALGDIAYTDDIIAAYRAGHQDSLARSRHAVYLREVFAIYNEILPRATQLAGIELPKWVSQASRQSFRACVVTTSQNFDSSERADLVESLRPWARSTGQQQLLERFERGERLRSFSIAAAIRPMLRELVGSLKAGTRAKRK